MIYHLKNPDNYEKPDLEWPHICAVALIEYLEIPFSRVVLELPKGRSLQVYPSLKRSWNFPELTSDIGVLCWPGYYGNSVHIIGWLNRSKLNQPITTSADYKPIESLKSFIEKYK